MAGFHDVISKLDGNRQILTDGNVDIPFRSFIVDTLTRLLEEDGERSLKI